MALHNLKIIVVDGGRSGGYKSENASVDEKHGTSFGKYKSSPLYQLLNAKETINKKVQSGISASSAFAINTGLKIGSQILSQTANYFISDIGRRNGDSSLQENINRQLEIVSDVAGSMGSALSGAATGSMFGPLGAALGAVAGIASSAISIGFRQAERERAFNAKAFQENNSVEYRRARASISLTTGRLR